MAAPASAQPLPMQLPNTSQPIATINAPVQGLLDSQGKPVTGTLNVSAFVTQAWRYYFNSFIQAAQSATQWVVSGKDIYNANTGFVGVNTKTPATFLDVKGTNAAFPNAASLPGELGNVAQLSDGSDAKPVTTITPSVSISRQEKLPSGADTEGGQNAALFVQAIGDNISAGGNIAQVNGIFGYGEQQGTGDCVGVFGVAKQDSGSFHAYGGFFTASAVANNGSSISVGTATFPPLSAAYNLSYYISSGGVGSFGIDLAGGGTGAGASNTAAALIRSSTPGIWDVGIYYATPVQTYYLYATIFNVDAAGHFNTTSDRAVKEKISAIPDGALARIMHLVPSTFIYINDSKKRVYAGLIAQDVREVMPEAVSANAEDHLMTNDACIIAYLIKAVQELEQQVRVLHAALGAART